MDALAWILVFFAVAIGGTTCAVVSKSGQWSARTACVAHHEIDECEEMRPKGITD